MILRLSAALAASVMLLAACGSDANQSQPAQSQPVAYEAGESESRQQTEAESEQVPVVTGTEQTQQSQPLRTQGPAPSASEQEEGETERVPVVTGTEQTQQSQPLRTQGPAPSPSEEAMVGQIIESGHRAGLFADRNSLGDPDAPIVITEYSDFL